MKKYSIYIPLMAVALLLTACSKKEEKKQADEADEIPVVKVETVHERDVVQKGEYTASVEADKINNISAAMMNRIREIYVDEGQRVSKGQKLVLLDDVNTDNYKIQLDNAKANLANIMTDYNRALELFKIGGGTRQSVDQLQTQVTNARNAVAAAERTLRNAAENTVLVSPINGVVTARNYDPGDMTGQLPILTISQVQPVKTVINVSESEYALVKRGMPATVKFDTYGDREFSGFVTLISPTVDAASRTFAVEITLPNKDNAILPGMFGRVSLDLGSARHIVVPDKAVIKQPGSGNKYVYTYQDGTVQYVQVELGQRLDDAYEIISGIADNAQVVVSGQSRLANGMKVRLAK